MRVVARISAAVALLALVGVTTARAQHPQTRKGFWIGFGFGYGSLGLSCSGCGSIPRQAGLSGYLKMGGTLNDHLLIGGESDGWTKYEDGSIVSAGNVSFAVYYYPAPASGVFLRGGVGFADYQVPGNINTGVGFTVGAGYDLRVGSNVSITPVANYNWGSVGETLHQNVIQLALGVTWH